MTATNSVFLALYGGLSFATYAAMAVTHKKYKLQINSKQISLWVLITCIMLLGGDLLLFHRTIFTVIGMIVALIVFVAIALSKTYLRDSTITVLGQMATSFVFWPGFLVIGLYLTANGRAIDELDDFE